MKKSLLAIFAAAGLLASAASAIAGPEVNTATGAVLVDGKPAPGLAAHDFEVVAYFTEGKPAQGDAAFPPSACAPGVRRGKSSTGAFPSRPEGGPGAPHPRRFKHLWMALRESLGLTRRLMTSTMSSRLKRTSCRRAVPDLIRDEFLFGQARALPEVVADVGAVVLARPAFPAPDGRLGHAKLAGKFGDGRRARLDVGAALRRRPRVRMEINLHGNPAPEDTSNRA